MKKWQQTYGHNSVKSSRSPRKFHSKICNNVVVVRGLQCPKNAPRSQYFKIFTILRGYCAQTLYASSSEPISFCTPRGPLVIPSMQLRAAPKILAPGPPGRPTPKKVFPKFFKNLRGEVQIFERVIRGPQGPPGIKFWQLYLGPLLQKKITKFRWKSTISRVRRKFQFKKRLSLCALVPPICGPKCTPVRWLVTTESV